MAALLAFASSMVWGIGDFYGGVLSRRRDAIAVVVAMQTFGLITVLLWSLATNAWEIGPFMWSGLAAGISGSLGLMAFYRALAIGTMGIVSPIAALGVVVPLMYGLTRGEQPSTLQWLAIAIAILGVLAASGPELSGGASPRPLILASIAAAMFGVALAFMAAGASNSGGSPTMTVLTMRVVQVAIGSVLWVRWRGFGGLTMRDLPLAALTGVFDVGANLLYSVAAALGPVTIVAVLGSFPPVATALLGRILLHERLKPIQYAGIGLALLGAAGINAG
ncbi:MAG: EamA family transporter [Candidatus Nanopelagicales bacterium]